MAVLMLLVPGCCSPKAPADVELRKLTIDRLVWSDDPGLPTAMAQNLASRDPALLAHVEEWHGFPAMKEFTSKADKEFELRRGEEVLALALCGTGGITSSDGRIRFVILRVVQRSSSFDRTTPTELVPRNAVEGYTWVVADEVVVPADGPVRASAQASTVR